MKTETKDCKCCKGKKKCDCPADCTKCDCNHKKDEMKESYFDKFMDSILISERVEKKISVEKDSPMRERIKRHQEKPLNRITYK